MQYSTRTPHKLRTAEPATARNLRELLRARIAEVNAEALARFNLPRNAPVTVEPAQDGYGPRLRLFHRGLEIIFSFQPGADVIARHGTLLTPLILRDVEQIPLKKISWRYAKPAKAAA